MNLNPLRLLRRKPSVDDNWDGEFDELYTQQGDPNAPNQQYVQPTPVQPAHMQQPPVQPVPAHPRPVPAAQSHVAQQQVAAQPHAQAYVQPQHQPQPVQPEPVQPQPPVQPVQTAPAQVPQQQPQVPAPKPLEQRLPQSSGSHGIRGAINTPPPVRREMPEEVEHPFAKRGPAPTASDVEAEREFIDRYTKSKREWDEMFATASQRENRWRLASFCSLAVAAVAVIGCVVLSGRQTVIPHIVEVNKEGTILSTYDARSLNHLVSDQLYRTTIHDWLVAFRGITLDPEVQATRLHKTAGHLRTGDPARSIVHRGLQARNPFVLMQEQVVHVTVDEIKRVSEGTWYVIWTERTTNLSDGVVKHDTYSATLYIQQAEVEKAQMLYNPLGIYVVEIDYNKSEDD